MKEPIKWCPTVKELIPPQIRGKILLKHKDLILPIARQVFAKTLAADIVPVKPLSAPTGVLFYPDIKYNKTNEQDKRI